MMFYRILFGVSMLFILLQCEDREDAFIPETKKKKTGNESRYTIKEGELTVLVDNSLSSYFIYRGEPKGFEYELLNLFAQEHNLKLHIEIIHNFDNILDSLISGYGDLVAANLAISEKRKRKVNFTQPLFQTRQVLVQRLPANYRDLTANQIDNSLVKDPIQLEGKQVMVRKSSSYYDRLQNFKSETGINFEIIESPDYLVTEYLIEMVAENKIEYTICDENKSRLLCPSFYNIDCSTPVSFSQNIGWAVRKESSDLLDTLNRWIEKEKGNKTYNMIYSDYFEAPSKTRKVVRNEFKDIISGQISDYDELIREYASKINWDWRLLSALIYQESRFNPDSRSWAGAVGLMQLMPRTAKSYGISQSELTTPEKNLKAGTDHLEWLSRQWNTVISDSVEAIKFTLASYNVGFGHVSDARRIAKSNGMNPDKWDDSVEQMLLLKTKPKYYNLPEVKYGYCRGTEPVNYVRDILENYRHYQEYDKPVFLTSLL